MFIISLKFKQWTLLQLKELYPCNKHSTVLAKIVKFGLINGYSSFLGKGNLTHFSQIF